ncbi:MAG: manganese transporter permease [Halobacteriovoraceae bacterium]|nr:manganese transporter permease [Halobacteriovoraceae bacterium]MBT5092805.1 manganese transporter permease [Halobacteriovoraceae bacterium]
MSEYTQVRKKQIGDWFIFTQERFEPVSHFLMIIMFLAAHYFVVDASKFVILEPIQLLWVTLGTIAFFLKLRFYDEIKDYDTDMAYNPTRPLPRGLVKHFDVKKGIENCIILEIIFFTTCGVSGFISIILAIAYSLAMYREFFIGDLIRPHLTTYATTHTVVTIFISVSIFSAMSRYYFWDMDGDFYLFAIANWLLFNIFELGRKVYQPCEERDGVDTYSSIWGKFGAVILVFSQAAAVGVLLLYISTIDFFFMQAFQAFSLGTLGLISIIYLIRKTVISGKLFRAFSSFYIVLIYLGVIANYLIRRYS